MRVLDRVWSLRSSAWQAARMEDSIEGVVSVLFG